ncbi:MAG: DUF885 domain-containing protein [Opitutus sp.]
MIRKILKILGVVVSVVALAGAIFLVNLVWFRPWSLDLFFEKVFVEFALQNPELLTRIGILESVGYRAHNAHLDDVSIAQMQKMQALARKDLAELKSYTFNRQSPSQQLSTRVLTWFFDNQIEGERYAVYDYPVNQMFGLQSATIEFMVDIHRIPDRKGAEHYLSRLGEVGRKFNQIIEGLQYREEHGIVPPRFVLQRVLVEMRAFAGKPVRENVLYTTFAKRVDALPKLSADEKATLKARCETSVTSAVYPDYGRLIDACAALESKATTDDGVWKFPQGDAFYAYLLRTSTTTSMTPQEVHDLGLREVARIEQEMRTVLAAVGEIGETPAIAMTRLGAEPRFHVFAATDAGRAAVLSEYSRLLEESLECSKKYFGLLPKARLEVRRVPEFKEKTSAAAYYLQAAQDGSRPGVFYANLRDVAGIRTLDMKTLAYHEGNPGHHFQFSVAQELKGLPMFRSELPFTAYIEGWALYAESLAPEMGLYENDPYGNLGRLQLELLRAVRLVVDTGIHYKRWTREQAIDYMLEKTGDRNVTEVERYIVMPGQACAYMVGMLKIRNLRARAEQQLGAKFSLSGFHDAVLRNGPLPLDLLDELVNAWIAESK